MIARRLTLLYAIPFVLTGAFFVTVPLLGASQTAPAGTGEPPPAVTVHFPYTTWLLSLAGMTLVSLVLGRVVAGRYLRPLRTIIAAAREISAGDLHRRLGAAGGVGEFGELARTLDGLFARLEAAFEAQRTFVANASHELRTPLTAERALLQVALADPEPSVASLREACEEVLLLGAAQERLIAALLTLARGELATVEAVDLAAVVSAVFPDAAVAPAWVSGDPRLIGSLVANLADNATRHNVPGGWVRVTVAGTRLEVSNTGPVVPAGEMDRLFEPFQQLRRQRTGDGHGLGLAIVRAIAAAHGADLAARPRDGGGLVVTVDFRPWSAPPA